MYFPCDFACAHMHFILHSLSSVEFNTIAKKLRHTFDCRCCGACSCLGTTATNFTAATTAAAGATATIADVTSGGLQVESYPALPAVHADARSAEGRFFRRALVSVTRTQIVASLE